MEDYSDLNRSQTSPDESDQSMKYEVCCQIGRDRVAGHKQNYTGLSSF